MSAQGPYTHWAEGDIVISMKGLRCSGSSPADARKRLKHISRDMDAILRRYWQLGPRSKDLITEVTFLAHEKETFGELRHPS